MSDLRCTCSPTPSFARTLNGINNTVISLAGRVTDLEAEDQEQNDRLDAFAVAESPFIVVDTEPQLDAALLKGKHILLRGEGNLGEIPLTTQKSVLINGTKLWGYGYKKNSDVQFSKLTMELPAPLSGFRNGFNVEATDVEFAGFEICANPADWETKAYMAINLSKTVNVARCHVHDLHVHHVNRSVTREAGSTAPVIDDLTVERCYVHTYIGYGVSFTHGMNNARILDNRFIPILSGDTHTDPNIRGVYFAARNTNCLVQGNVVKGVKAQGIEMTSIQIAGDAYYDNLRNRILANTIEDAEGFGISLGFGVGGIVEGNSIKNVAGIGIESAGNYATTNSQFKNIIAGNFIDGVTGAVTASGVSIDKTNGDLVTGNRIENISAASEGRGVSVYEANFCKVNGNLFRACGHRGVAVNRGTGSNTGGFHVIDNNTFRSIVSEAALVAQRAIYIFDTTAVVRGNVAFQAAGTVQSYEANCLAPALVYTHMDATTSLAAGAFTGSNLTIAY